MVMMQIMKIHGFQLQSCAEANQITQQNIYRQCQSVPMNTSHNVYNSLNEYTAFTLI